MSPASYYIYSWSDTIPASKSTAVPLQKPKGSAQNDVVTQHLHEQMLNQSQLTLSLLPNIFIEPTPSTASFSIMNDIVPFLILQKLAVPRVCNSSHDYVLPY